MQHIIVALQFPFRLDGAVRGFIRNGRAREVAHNLRVNDDIIKSYRRFRLPDAADAAVEPLHEDDLA